MKKFFKEAGAVIGYLFGIVGTFVTIWTLSGNVTIKIRWLVILGVILLSSVVIAIMATKKLNTIIKNGTKYKITAYAIDNNKNLYYTDFSKCLRVGTIVTIYYSKPISKRLGFGIVYNSSVDEYIEIEVIHVERDFLDIFEQSKTNHRKVLDDMYILPNTYNEELKLIVKKLEEGGYLNEKS